MADGLFWTFPLQDAVKVMAKSLVRNRHAVTKMYGLKSQLQAVSLRIAVRCPRTRHAPGAPCWSAVRCRLHSESELPAACCHLTHNYYYVLLH